MAQERIEDAGIAVEFAGEVPPTLVFVHGFGCTRHDWTQQVATLSARFRCVSFDLPGHGESAPPASGDIEILARAVCAVTARYAHGPTILIGHSLGSRVILEAMRLCPRGVVGLVLAEQNLVTGLNAERAATAIEQRIDALGFHSFISPLFDAMFVPTSSPGLRLSVWERLQRLDPELGKLMLLSSVLWEARAPAQLAALRVPVLLLQSTYLDEQMTWHSLRHGMSTPWIELVTRLVADTRVHIIEGVGHFSPIEAAQTVSSHILDFAHSLAGAAER